MGSEDRDDDVRSRANETRDDGGPEEETAESQWRFSVDEVGPDGVTEDTHTPADEPIEPGTIDLEHAAFVALGVALTVGVFVLGDQFLTLYFGPEYEESIRPLRLLLPGILGFAVARVVWPVLQAGGHLRRVLLATGTAVVTNIVLNLLLIPRFGLTGAAIATSISYGGMALLHGGAAHLASLHPFEGLSSVRIIFSGAVTLVVLSAAEELLSPPVSLLVIPVVGLLVYALCIFGTGVLSLRAVSSSIVAELEDGSGPRTE